MTHHRDSATVPATGHRTPPPADRDPAADQAAEPLPEGRYRAMVVTASRRAAAGVYADRGGPLIVEGLAALGFRVDGPRVVPDGDPVEAVLREAVADSYDVVVSTGGTGVSPTDRTPEATRRVLDYEIPGIAEAIRAEGLATVPAAALSRGLAGVAGTTLIVNLPGRPAGSETAWWCSHGSWYTPLTRFGVGTIRGPPLLQGVRTERLLAGRAGGR